MRTSTKTVKYSYTWNLFVIYFRKPSKRKPKIQSKQGSFRFQVYIYIYCSMVVEAFYRGGKTYNNQNNISSFTTFLCFSTIYHPTHVQKLAKAMLSSEVVALFLWVFSMPSTVVPSSFLLQRSDANKKRNSTRKTSHFAFLGGCEIFK